MVTRSQLNKLGSQIESLALQLGMSNTPPPPFECPAIVVGFGPEADNTSEEWDRIRAWDRWRAANGIPIEYEIIMDFVSVDERSF